MTKRYIFAAHLDIACKCLSFLTVSSVQREERLAFFWILWTARLEAFAGSLRALSSHIYILIYKPIIPFDNALQALSSRWLYFNTTMNNNAQSSENNTVMIETLQRMIYQNMRLCNLPVSVFTIGNNGKQYCVNIEIQKSQVFMSFYEWLSVRVITKIRWYDIFSML